MIETIEEIQSTILQEYGTILQRPDWYLFLKDIFSEYFWEYEKNKKGKDKVWFYTREAYVAFIQEAYEKNVISLGSDGYNHDKGRLPIDTIVIHHTSTHHTVPLSRIDALILIRLYCRYYADKTNSFYGQPIWSGHFYDHKQTFITYHYLIRRDGTILHILADNQMGWQAGNLDVNNKSIAIAFIDELEHASPSSQALASAQSIIRSYSGIKEIVGHNEVNSLTDCPGDSFLKGWKSSLLNYTV